MSFYQHRYSLQQILWMELCRARMQHSLRMFPMQSTFLQRFLARRYFLNSQSWQSCAAISNEWILFTAHYKQIPYAQQNILMNNELDENTPCERWLTCHTCAMLKSRLFWHLKYLSLISEMECVQCVGVFVCGFKRISTMFQNTEPFKILTLTKGLSLMKRYDCTDLILWLTNVNNFQNQSKWPFFFWFEVIMIKFRSDWMKIIWKKKSKWKVT